MTAGIAHASDCRTATLTACMLCRGSFPHEPQWAQLTLPVPISLHFYSMEASDGPFSDDQAPAQWILAGSNDKVGRGACVA
jgi:hypothetical protein